jgi:hypothetical protein
MHLVYFKFQTCKLHLAEKKKNKTDHSGVSSRLLGALLIIFNIKVKKSTRLHLAVRNSIENRRIFLFNFFYYF